MPAKLCENMRRSCMLGRADANRQASVLFDGRLESATIMQGRGCRGHAGGAGGSGVKRNVFSAGGNATQGKCTANPAGS